MKCIPFTFQCAHFTWVRKSVLSANRWFSKAISACRLFSGTPTLLGTVRSIAAAAAGFAMIYASL
jgi:hypothetical protein